MREFRDDQGRPWLVKMSVEAAKRVKATVKVDGPDGKEIPFDLIDTATINLTLTILRSKFIVVGEVLAALLDKQIEEKGLTKEQFLDDIRGDSLDTARKVIEDEIIDFFPKHLRKITRLTADKMLQLQTTLTDRAEASIEAVTVESLLEQSGTPFTKQQESSVSIPQTGLTENSQLQETAA